jgi:hypothetical protein
LHYLVCVVGHAATADPEDTPVHMAILQTNADIVVVDFDD